MSANHKLTAAIKGRTIQEAKTEADALLINFNDGSTMKVKTGADAGTADCSGRKIKSVQQEGTALTLTFADGSTNEIPLAEETSSVMVRDKENKMEYAD
jgi:hypothetical protein